MSSPQSKYRTICSGRQIIFFLVFLTFPEHHDGTDGLTPLLLDAVLFHQDITVHHEDSWFFLDDIRRSHECLWESLGVYYLLLFAHIFSNKKGEATDK
mgnify:CR=1 FL=1